MPPTQKTFIPGDWIRLEDILLDIYQFLNEEYSLTEIQSDIFSNDSDIVVLKSDILVVASDLDSLSVSDVTTNTSDIVILKSDIAALGSSSDVVTNISDIVVLKSDVIANDSNFTTADSNIQIELDAVSDIAVANASDIVLLGTELDAVSDVAVANTSDITVLDDALSATKEPTGFPNRTDSAISFNDGTRRFTINPSGASFDYFIARVKYTVSSSDVLNVNYVYLGATPAEGPWWIYYDGTTLTAALSPNHTAIHDIFENKAVVAIVFWDADNNKGQLLEERHGLSMSAATHILIHETVGSRFESGLALNSITADQNGSADSHAKFGVDAGQIFDEDIEHTLNAVASATGLQIWYRDTSGWTFTTNAGFSMVTTGTGRLAYDNNGTLAEVDNGDYVLCHIFAGSFSHKNPVVAIGQAQYATKKLAQQGALSEIVNILSIANVSPELKPIASVIFRTWNNYANAVKAIIVSTEEGDDYVDFRTDALSPAFAAAQDHGNLAGLGDDDHPLYSSDIAVVASNLLVGDSDIQIELDAVSDIAVANASNIITGDSDIQIEIDAISDLVVADQSNIVWMESDIDTNTSDIAAHVHDGATLKHDGVNSDGGAFAFNTTGAVTHNQNTGITKADPEHRLTDSGDSEYTRVTRADTSAVAARYNKVGEPGGTGGGLDFDGVNDWVDIAPAGGLSGSSTYTVMFWAKSPVDYSNTRVAISIYKGTGTGDLFILYPFWGDGGVQCFFAGATRITDSVDRNDGNFHLFVFVTRSSTDHELFVDNVSIGTSSISWSLPSGLTNIQMGAWKGIQDFKGVLDEVAIWNKALSNNDIGDLWNSGTGMYVNKDNLFATDGGSVGDDLVGLWHLDDETGDVATDSSDSGNDGALSPGSGHPAWDTGIVPTPGADTEVQIWKSQDGIGSFEEGIQTFGDPDGRTVIEGQTTRFNIGGVEKGQIDASGNIAFAGTVSGSNISDLVTADSDIQIELDAVSDVAVANASNIVTDDSDLKSAVSDLNVAYAAGDWGNASDIKVTFSEMITAFSNILG